MKKLKTYLDLCTQVYELSKPQSTQDAYEFYRAYALESSGPILEPMCGSGRFLLPFLEEGFDIDGFDASESMLQALHVKAQEKNLKPSVWHSFIEDFQPNRLYNLIIIPSGSFGLITDLNAVQKVLNHLYQWLLPGGKLVMEIETSQAASKQQNVWRGSFWTNPEQEIIAASFLDLPLINNVSVTLCKYELMCDNKVMRTEVEEFKVRLYDLQHMIQLLQQASFTSIAEIKAFDRNKQPDAADSLIIYECIKSK